MTTGLVTKRSGDTELFNIDKIHRVLEWACQDLVGVSVSEIEMRANVQIYEKMRSTSIHDLLIKSSSELITEATPNYQYVAARLINYKLKKLVYADKTPWPLIDIINHNIEAGVYDADILNKYSLSRICKFFVTTSKVILESLEKVFIKSRVDKASLIAPSAF